MSTIWFLFIAAVIGAPHIYINVHLILIAWKSKRNECKSWKCVLLRWKREDREQRRAIHIIWQINSIVVHWATQPLLIIGNLQNNFQSHRVIEYQLHFRWVQMEMFCWCSELCTSKASALFHKEFRVRVKCARTFHIRVMWCECIIGKWQWWDRQWLLGEYIWIVVESIVNSNAQVYYNYTAQMSCDWNGCECNVNRNMMLMVKCTDSRMGHSTTRQAE